MSKCPKCLSFCLLVSLSKVEESGRWSVVTDIANFKLSWAFQLSGGTFQLKNGDG